MYITCIGIGQLQVYDTDISLGYFMYYELLQNKCYEKQYVSK